jgi:hypothetical protein
MTDYKIITARKTGSGKTIDLLHIMFRYMLLRRPVTKTVKPKIVFDGKKK